MKKITRVLAVLLSLLVIAGALAACQQTTPTAAPTQKPTTAPTVKPTDKATEAPATQPTEPEYTGNKKKREKGTIVVGVPQKTSIENYDTNEWTLWLEEQTGLNIEFEFFASAQADYRSQLATRVANWENEELPDVLWGFNLTDDTIKTYGEDGFFVDLRSYYDDPVKSASFREQLARGTQDFADDIMRRLVDPDTGAIYCTARIEYCLIDPMRYQLYINQEWLDKLGLAMPTNLTELHDVLIAFRDRDPNGNGLKDEIPIFGNAATSFSRALEWLVNFFVYFDLQRIWSVDDNQNVYCPYTTDEYREAMKLIHEWFQEGLINSTYFSAKNKDCKALMNPTDGVETIGIVCTHSSITYSDGAETMYDYVPLKLVNYAIENPQGFNKRCYITGDCQYPDDAWNLLMAMNSIEGSRRGYFGVKGRDWDDADPGAKSAFGFDAEIKVINHVWGSVTTQNWSEVNFFLWWSENEYTQLSDEMSDWEKAREATMCEYYQYYQEARAKNNPKYYLSSALIYSQEEKDKTETIRSNCQAYFDETFAAFAIGDLDPNDDKVWTDYLKQLDDLGLKTWTEQAQRLYDEQQRK